jgi:hypothetical protein
MSPSPAQVAYVQGVQTNDTVVDPLTFAQFTRRTRFPMKSSSAIGGLGTSDQIQLKKTGIISALEIRVAGSVVIGGTIGTTTMSYEWPYNLIKALKLSVNGQSTLIDTRGLDLKLADIALDTDVTDKGVDQRYGNATAVGNGTMSLSHEDWGGTGAASNYMAPGLNVAAIGTYPIDLTYVVPVAADQTNLVGSIFGQSQATNINVEIVYASQSELFSAVGGSATVSFAGVTIDVTGVAYSIPVVNGKATVPDLSQLHGVNTFQNQISVSGDSEINLPGTGQGRKLLRLWWNTYSSATPLVMNATNYGNLAYKYGSNTVPETLPNGSKLRALNERQVNSDIGKCWGYGMWDFASRFALRDVIDLGTTSDFRLLVGLVSTPTSGKIFITQETLYAAAIGA